MPDTASEFYIVVGNFGESWSDYDGFINATTPVDDDTFCTMMRALTPKYKGIEEFCLCDVYILRGNRGTLEGIKKELGSLFSVATTGAEGCHQIKYSTAQHLLKQGKDGMSAEEMREENTAFRISAPLLN